MRRLTPAESTEQLRALDFRMDGHHVFPRAKAVYAIDLEQPKVSRAQAVLARDVAEAVTGPDAFFWVTEAHVWPTEEWQVLFQRAMAGYGDSRLLHEAPGFVFDLAAEAADLQDLFRFALSSGWSAVLVGRSSRFGFALTDDDWFGLFGETEAEAEQWIDKKCLEDCRVLWRGAVAQ